jgi:hypothetical protein
VKILQTYHGKARLVTYIDVDLYQKLEEERKITNETQSGFIYGILDVVLRGQAEETI